MCSSTRDPFFVPKAAHPLTEMMNAIKGGLHTHAYTHAHTSSFSQDMYSRERSLFLQTEGDLVSATSPFFSPFSHMEENCA